MNALHTPDRSAQDSERLGLDADAWFFALDNRVLQMGTDTCVAQVLGIHISDTGLWIQLACATDAAMAVVLVVSATTRLDDVLDRLRTDPPSGNPLEIIQLTESVAGQGPKTHVAAVGPGAALSLAH